MSETTPKLRYVADDHTVYTVYDTSNDKDKLEPVALAMGPVMAERIAAALNADEGKAALLEQNAKMRQALEMILRYKPMFDCYLDGLPVEPELAHTLLVDIPDLCECALAVPIDPAAVVQLDNDGEDFPF